MVADALPVAQTSVTVMPAYAHETLSSTVQVVDIDASDAPKESCVVNTPVLRPVSVKIKELASVDSTDNVEGRMYVEWSKATEFDTIAAPGPYKYLIYRSDDIWGQNMILIDSLMDINDTIYNDINFNY